MSDPPYPGSSSGDHNTHRLPSPGSGDHPQQPPGWATPPLGGPQPPEPYGIRPTRWPPPGGGYPQAPFGYGRQTSPHFSAGDAFAWAWNKFTKNIVALLIPMSVYLAASILVLCVPVLMALLGGDTSNTDTSTPAASTSATVIASIFIALLAALLLGLLMMMHAGFVSGCLDLADGKPVSMRSFFKPRHVGGLLGTMLLVGLLWLVATLLCVVPGMIVAFLAQFALFFVVDRAQSPVAAIRASFATVRGNGGDALVAWFIQYAVALAGMLLCYVGLIAALPVVALLQAYTYRKLSGGQLAALTP
jgi:uncharacterized membrane protein